MLDECVKIREGLREVKRQFQFEQAEPNFFRGGHATRFQLEVEIVKEYGRLAREHLQNRAMVTCRAYRKLEHVPVGGAVSCQDNLKGA